jgi:NAD+-dependent protein deacetylase SIR2
MMLLVFESKKRVLVVRIPYTFISIRLNYYTITYRANKQQTGAGISTSAGIPDFRSPGTGLYANLARLNLPFPEAVFDISFFRKNPAPFYTLAHEIYPGKYRPTITHSFVALLHEKQLLHKLFTQNIDCLEREAGVPDQMIIEAHGSFATQRCIDCETEYPDSKMRECIKAKIVPTCDTCEGLVKPDIVFFGESLPKKFFEARNAPAEADLVIVMGTSLTVMPFASLPELIPQHIPRLLINKERAGGMGSRPDDVLLLGDCDEQVRKFAEACGWLEELEELWAKTAPKDAVDIGKPEKESRSKDEILEDEIEKLTKEVDSTLKMADDHRAGAKAHIEKMLQNRLEKEKKGDDKDANDPSITMMGPSVIDNKIVGADVTKDDLDHVFPHMKGKPTL